MEGEREEGREGGREGSERHDVLVRKYIWGGGRVGKTDKEREGEREGGRERERRLDVTV